MKDNADDLILKMQHLEAAAKAEQASRTREDFASSLKSRAQKMAAEAQAEVTRAEGDVAGGEARQQQARSEGLNALRAAELLVSGRELAQDGKNRLVKARARLNFALDQMDEAERVAYDALRASAMAEAHTQLAETGAGSSGMPTAPETLPATLPTDPTGPG